MEHPDWALVHKRKGTELRCIRGKYYLYEITSVWDKQRKRAVKKTGKCLGTISEKDGFKTSKSRLTETVKDISVNPKVFGSFSLFKDIAKPWEVHLKKYFPNSWKQILCMAYTRLFKKSPIKNMPFFYEQSFYHEYYNGLAFSDKTISSILRDIGLNQSIVEQFMREFIPEDNLILIDATPIFSKSQNIHESRFGYNNKKQWDTQVNLLYLYSRDTSLPLFFKLSPGDIREVKTLELALLAAGIKNAIIVGDKGFTSRLNLEIIECNDLSYILPLKRNDSLIDYSDINIGKTSMKSFFKFKNRYIWYITRTLDNNRRVTIFLDDQLRVAEEHDYLDRIEKYPDNYSLETFHSKQSSMGTISTIDNLPDKSPKEIYQIYKSRCEIEQLFDIFKNGLEADKTYMHSMESLRGWMFINHLALIAYYKIYILLQTSSLLDKFSVNDILEILYHISMVFVGNQWKLQTISMKTEKLLKKIDLNLPITWNAES
ncbi:transposase [Candidatus Dojkabacteria bacterium]|nr:transposase [Candidatus Dojkabacteria bacterium]